MKNKTSLLLTPLFLVACTPMIDTHGTIINDSQLEEIHPGSTTQDQVKQLLGSPAMVGTLNNNRWIYMTSTIENKPLDPNILKQREVIVVDFDPSGTVAAVGKKTQADSKTIEPVEKVTPTHGQSLGILDQMMKNIGVDKDK